MGRRLFTQVLPLVIIAALVAALTIIPYFSNKQAIEADRQHIQYLCQFSLVVRDFTGIAANVRLKTAQVGNPKLRALNLTTHKKYLRIERRLKNLPPDKFCGTAHKKGK